MMKIIIRWFFGLCAIAGFIIVLAVAGTADFNLESLFVQNGIGLALILVGFIGVLICGIKDILKK